MTRADDDSGGHVPLPPEQPPEIPEQPPGPPPDLSKEPVPDDGTGAPTPADAESGDWWRWPDVREELDQAWDQHGTDAMEAAAEVGAHIGEAISARLPDQHTDDGPRLDVSWMRLTLNGPAAVVAGLLVWSGNNPASALGRTVVENGIFAPLGWLIVPGFLLAGLMFLPVGGALVGVVGQMVRGLGRSLVKAWGTKGPGYVLRLLVAIGCWSVVLTVLGAGWRVLIYWLTGAQ